MSERDDDSNQSARWVFGLTIAYVVAYAAVVYVWIFA